jgi:hypothetical protein
MPVVAVPVAQSLQRGLDFMVISELRIAPRQQAARAADRSCRRPAG